MTTRLTTLERMLTNAFGRPRKAYAPRSTAPSLAALRRRAAKLGVTIDRERDAVGWAYWLNDTGWEEGNFCADRDELAAAIAELEAERKATA
jgi:hypothetical protein